MKPMIERKDIERLAELARIRITPEEAEELRKEIDPILEYVGQVSDIAGQRGGETAEGALRNVMRDDDSPREPEADTETLLEAAPARQGRHFKVKKILGGGDNA